MKRIITLTKRNFKEMLRDPLSLIFMIGLLEKRKKLEEVKQKQQMEIH